MKKKINPNRMQLFRLRKRLVLAQRGHKLLKDKLEGLVQEVTELLVRYKKLRIRFDKDFPRLLARFTLASAVAPQGAVAEAVRQNASIVPLGVEDRRVMGVAVPTFTAPPQPDAYRYSLTQTPPELDVAFEELRKLPEMLFELAEVEKTLLLLAHELERTRRRTNALEYVLIPELQADRKDVEQKIGEQERSNISRLMKIKDMLMAKR
ncbi:MAG: V-type ATP synthase subunit D [Planctomycetota bacterium]